MIFENSKIALVLLGQFQIFKNAPGQSFSNLPPKHVKFQYKVFSGLVWLTRNHMFRSGDFGDKSPSWFLKLPSFYTGNFKILKNAFGQSIRNFPDRNVITSTNLITKS